MKVLVFLFTLCAQMVSAQSIPWIENFENQSIPSYFEGHLSRFSIFNHRLYLNHIFPSSQNESQIVRYAPIKNGHPHLWEIDISLDFSPSPQNNLRVYLSSSHPNLSLATQAWYLQVGGESGDQDKLSLVRQKNNQRIPIAESLPGILGSKSVQMSLRITLDANKLWSIYTKLDSSQNWNFSFSHKENEEMNGFFTGLMLIYTTSRAKHFNFDNWKIEGLVLDTTKAVIESWKWQTEKHLQIYFSKPLDSTLIKKSDFSLIDADKRKIDAFKISFDSLNPYLLTIYIDTLTPNVQHELRGKITDKSKNENIFILSLLQKYGVRPKAGELLITEILATPQSGKQAEFIEFYNQSSQTLLLSNLKIRMDKNFDMLPEIYLPAKEYFIFHPLKDSLFFKEVKNKHGSSKFPPLPNTGGNIIIEDNAGNVLEKMTFGLYPQWLHTLKTGKSLERRNLDDPSHCILNWTSCENENGHTLGQENEAELAPTLFFETEVDHIYPKNTDTLQFFAKVPLKMPELSDEKRFGEISSFIDTILMGGKANEWVLCLNKPISAKTIYPFTVLKGLKNCLEQSSERDQPLRLALPEKPNSVEKIFINEILFDALPYQKPFIEIQANTQYPIDFKSFTWGDGKKYEYEQRILFPFEPYAISENPEYLVQQYGDAANAKHIISGNTPILNRAQGNVTLFYASEERDIIQYDKKWHSPWLKSTAGISLERQGPLSNGQMVSAWLSSAGLKMGASPGKENASLGKESYLSPRKAFLEPAAFDAGDQVQYCKISPEFRGHIINIRIFDTYGNEVNYLIKNQILGNNDEIYWNGKHGNDEILAIGNYIWWIELLNANGRRTVLKLLSKIE